MPQKSFDTFGTNSQTFKNQLDHNTQQFDAMVGLRLTCNIPTHGECTDSPTTCHNFIITNIIIYSPGIVDATSNIHLY